MALSCKAGPYLYRIDPSDDRRLLTRTIGSSDFYYLWTAPNGEHILDLEVRGEELFIQTDRYNYIRKRNGSINFIN